MTTLMHMREWLFVDKRIREQNEIYERCVNESTVEVFRSLVHCVQDIRDYWRACDELDR